MRLPARLRQRRHARVPGSLEREGPITSHPETLELPELQPRGGGADTPDPDTRLGDPSTRRESDGSVCTRHSSRNKTVLGAFWTTHVSIVVQPEASRDHLGMLPRQPLFACISVAGHRSFAAALHPEPLPDLRKATRAVGLAAKHLQCPWSSTKPNSMPGGRARKAEWNADTKPSQGSASCVIVAANSVHGVVRRALAIRQSG